MYVLPQLSHAENLYPYNISFCLSPHATVCWQTTHMLHGTISFPHSFLIAPTLYLSISITCRLIKTIHKPCIPIPAAADNFPAATIRKSIPLNFFSNFLMVESSATDLQQNIMPLLNICSRVFQHHMPACRNSIYTYVSCSLYPNPLHELLQHAIQPLRKSVAVLRQNLT